MWPWSSATWVAPAWRKPRARHQRRDPLLDDADGSEMQPLPGWEPVASRMSRSGRESTLYVYKRPREPTGGDASTALRVPAAVRQIAPLEMPYAKVDRTLLTSDSFALPYFERREQLARDEYAKSRPHTGTSRLLASRLLAARFASWGEAPVWTGQPAPCKWMSTLLFDEAIALIVEYERARAAAQAFHRAHSVRRQQQRYVSDASRWAPLERRITVSASLGLGEGGKVRLRLRAGAVPLFGPAAAAYLGETRPCRDFRHRLPPPPTLLPVHEVFALCVTTGTRVVLRHIWEAHVERALGRWLRIADFARAAEQLAYFQEYQESLRLEGARRAVPIFVGEWASRLHVHEWELREHISGPAGGYIGALCRYSDEPPASDARRILAAAWELWLMCRLDLSWAGAPHVDDAEDYHLGRAPLTARLNDCLVRRVHRIALQRVQDLLQPRFEGMVAHPGDVATRMFCAVIFCLHHEYSLPTLRAALILDYREESRYHLADLTDDPMLVS